MRIIGCGATMAAAYWLVSTAVAAPVSIPLAGSDHQGYLAMVIKGWGSAAAAEAPDGLPDYPYYFDAALGYYRSIAAEPLAASSAYPQESTATVANKTFTDPDFATRSSGSIDFDDAALTGSGVETIGPEALGFTFNATGFSPLFSPHNAGSGLGNAGWDYVITADNLSGSGLTFVDGKLASIDLKADIAVIVRFGGVAPLTELGSTDPALFEGILQMAGNQFAFDLDVTQTVGSFLGQLDALRMVFNRSGTISAVVPEPAAGTLLAIAGAALATKRRRAARK